MPDATTVRLHADLQESGAGFLGHGLEAQRARVGVGADHGDGVAGLPSGTDGEGHDGGAVAGEVVFAAREEGGRPAVAFFDFFEAGGGEALDGGVDGVVGWGYVSRTTIDI